MLVSILMPNYNTGEALREAIASVEKQRGATAGVDFELILADDGSTDGRTMRILDDLSSLPWCTVISTGGRRGAAYARNLAATKARGRWFAFLDSDDLFSVDALSVRLAVAEQVSDAECVVTDYAEFENDVNIEAPPKVGALARNPVRRHSVSEAFETGRHITLDRPIGRFLGAMPMMTNTTMLRRGVFERLGGFPDHLAVAEDLYLWLRLSATSVIVFDPRVTAFYRHTPGSLTTDRLRLYSGTADCYRAILQLPEFRSSTMMLRKYLGNALREESFAARERRYFGRAICAGAAAVACKPDEVANWKALVKAPLPTRKTADP